MPNLDFEDVMGTLGDGVLGGFIGVSGRFGDQLKRRLFPIVFREGLRPSPTIYTEKPARRFVTL